MAEHKKQTNQVQTITLTSKIVQALWCQKLVMQEKQIDFEVYTECVGTGSKIEVTVKDKKGKTVAKTDGKVYSNYFGGTVTIPKKAKEEVSFTAKLPKHGLEKKSNTAVVIPLVEVINQKWSKTEAKPGEVLTLSANVEGAPDGTVINLFVFEYDREGAHDLITKFNTVLNKKKIEVEWALKRHEDTEKDAQENDSQEPPPEYFWMLGIGKERFGNETAPGLLKLKVEQT